MYREIERLDNSHILYRDENTGIAWVKDNASGLAYSAHPSIDTSGSVSGMKRLGYWKRSDKIVRSHGFYYNTSMLCISDVWDEAAAKHCMCDACRLRRQGEKENNR